MNKQIKRIEIPCYEEQKKNVADALSQGQLVYGPHLDELVGKLSELFGKKYVVLTANGFAALFLSLKAAASGVRDIMTVPASTCCAMTNAILSAGHRPVFSDIEPNSASLDHYPTGDADPVALIPDHFGIVAPACKNWQQGRGLLIEDAAQSFHSCIRMRSRSDILILSFYPTKITNGIDGGAILTDDLVIYEKTKRMYSYAEQYKWENKPRYNLKMSNINAAMALGSIAHLDEQTDRLFSMFEELSVGLESKGVEYLKPDANDVPSRLIVVADNEQQRNKWIESFEKESVPVGPELMSVCPAEMTSGFVVAQHLVSNSFSLPFHLLLEDQEIEQIKSAICKL